MPLPLDSFPMHLLRASQERGWVAAAIDLSNERAHWASLDGDERELFSRLIAGFRVGERGVTHELAPLQAKFRALYRENFDLMKRAVYERQLGAAV